MRPSAQGAGIVFLAPDRGEGLEDLGEPEVEDLHRVGAADHDVPRLEVAVDDAALVGGGDGVRERDGDLQEAVEGDPAGDDEGRERVALDELHREEEHALGFDDRVDGDDVRVAEGGDGLGLALEQGAAGRVVGDALGQDLDGDVAVEPEVAGPPDDAHAALAELVDQEIVGKRLSWLEASSSTRAGPAPATRFIIHIRRRRDKVTSAQLPGRERRGIYRIRWNAVWRPARKDDLAPRENDVLFEGKPEILPSPFRDRGRHAHLGGETAVRGRGGRRRGRDCSPAPREPDERPGFMEKVAEGMGIDLRPGNSQPDGLAEHVHQDLVPGETRPEFPAIDVLEPVGFGHHLPEGFRNVRLARSSGRRPLPGGRCSSACISARRRNGRYRRAG